MDSCDAYLEYIKSDAIKHLINQIYSSSSEIKRPEQCQVPHDEKYQKMIQKIDGMKKRSEISF